jgi:hypothetical protein
MRNWLFRETRNFAKQPVSFAKQRNSFRIEFRKTKSETSFAGNPMSDYGYKDSAMLQSTQWIINTAYNQRSLQSTPLFSA